MIVGKLAHKIIALIRIVFSEIVHTEIILDKYHNLAVVGHGESGVTDNLILDEPLIVSLTTFKHRIMDVYLVVESLLRQTVKPNRIILWLDETEFDDDCLPIVLKNQKQRGLEIRYCENIKSYKKIIPTLKLVDKATVVTVDDDVVYPFDFIEKLVAAYKKDKECVYFYRGRYIGHGKKGLLPYGKWKKVNVVEKRKDLLPTGIGGVMYPCGCFSKQVCDEKLFQNLCPNADDVWLRAMTLLNDYPCCLVEYPGRFRYSFVNIDRNQDIALSNTNLYANSNDKQIEQTFNYFNIIVE